MPFSDLFRKKGRVGRPAHEPTRDTRAYPQLFTIGQAAGQTKRAVQKPSPRNLRQFSRTVYARRAINAIKSPIGALDWEIVPIRGAAASAELDRQIEVSTYCLDHPNGDDNWQSFCHIVVEDILHGAGAYEHALGGDKLRPLWMWPVDGLTIEIFPGWAGNRDEARYAQCIGYGDHIGVGAMRIPLRNDELVYIKPNPSTATPFGLGPLEIAFTTIARALGVGEFAGNVASNARPSIGIDLGSMASREQVETFRAYWRNEVEGQGNMPIFAQGGEGNEKARGPNVIRLYPEGDGGLYLKYQEFLKSEIAAAFDLSPMNLGVERDVNRNTAEVAEDRDWDAAIKPMANLLAAHVTRETLHGKLGFSQLEFRFVGLDREDEDATAKIFKTYYESNAITPNEQRERIGMPPLENPFADLTFADVQIAVQAARGAAQVDDPDLPASKAPPGPAKVPSRKESKL